MRKTRAALLLAVACLSAGRVALAQSGPGPGAPDPGARDRSWSGDLTTYLYLQDEGNFVLPILSGDRGALHLEGRYQYEDRDTFSVWGGWTFSAGKRLQLELVPMVGVIMGQTKGVAPGLELTLSWKSLELYSESEYVFDVEGREGDYFYTWNELSWQATPWLRLGLSTQRTRLYQSELSIERGLFAAVSRGPVELSLYGYNLDGEAPFVIVAFGVHF
jgi:hypothetical protein